MKREWTSVISSYYSEKVFPNKKVGHATCTTKDVWRASLDGIWCGNADSMKAAQTLVDSEYEMRYDDGVLDRTNCSVLPSGNRR
jgi:hypothetical protein